MNNLKIAVGVPAYGGHVSSYHPRMWLEFGHTLSGSSERFSLVSFSHWDVNPVDRARNMMLADAISRKADWLLMIDADTFVEWTVDGDAGYQLLTMISEADRRGAAIVVAPVMTRTTDQRNQHLMVYRLDDTSKRATKLEPYDVYAPSIRAVLAASANPLVEIDSAATAVMAIHVPTAERADAGFQFTTATEGANGEIAPGLSEDHEFCRQIREACGPGKIFCDPRVKTGHISKSFPIYNTISNPSVH